MKILTMPRRSGKTTLAIKESARTGWVIVCPTYQHAHVIKDMAKSMGVDIPEPIPITEFSTLLSKGRRVEGVIIDDLDECLFMLFCTSVRMITLSPPPPSEVIE